MGGMAKNSDAAEGGPTRVVEGRLNTPLQMTVTNSPTDQDDVHQGL